MPEITKRHSVLGIASGAFGCVTFAVYFLSTVFYYLQFENMVAVPLNRDLAVLQMAAVLLMPIPVHLFCLLCAVVALFFPNRKKLFPILSVTLNFIFALLSLFPWLWVIFKSMGRV